MTLCWMAVIFWFSAQESQASSELSGGFIEKLLSALWTGFDELDPGSQTALVDSLQSLVRKCAHAGVYGVLGILVFCFMSTFSISPGRRFVVVLALCAMYAASDEIHQYFVPGRSCEMRDVAIDSLGSLAGATLCHLIYYVNKKKRRHRHG